MRNLLTKKTTYTFDYPEALAFADKQNGVFWTFDEIDLEKDVHSILTDFTPAERHGVTTALKLFTKCFERPADLRNFGRPILTRRARTHEL